MHASDVVANLCTHQGVSLLWQWLAQENVVAIFLAPPCGSASRARQIPLKRTLGKNSHAPLPLRDDLFPNGKPGLSFRAFHLQTSCITLPASLLSAFHLQTSCITLPASLLPRPIWLGALCAWKTRSSAYFGKQRFGQQLQNRCNTVFFIHVNMVVSERRRRCWLLNHEAFHAVSAKCKGQNSKHKHAAWGLDKEKKKFATCEETACPMGLAKLLANCIAMALITLGIKAPEETVHQLKSTSLKSLQQMKAATGVQPKASRIPPLVPTSKLVLNCKLWQWCCLNFHSIKNVEMISNWMPQATKYYPHGPNSSLFNLQRLRVTRGVVIRLCLRLLRWAKQLMWMGIIVNNWFKLGAARGRPWNLLKKQ